MPKLKTKRAAAKRFRKLARGGFKRSQAFLRHILTKKNAKRRRRLRHATAVQSCDRRAVRAMLPYC